MKMDCEVIRDLLPLYAENMVSAQSRALTEEHLAECEPCRQYLADLTAPEPDVQFRVDSAQQFVRYEKKKKRKFGTKVVLATLLTVCAVMLLIGILFFGTAGLFVFSIVAPTVHADTDPAHYGLYMGENAKKEYRQKCGMDETLFPAALTDNMQVQEYKMVYYNPWDPQYLSYLTVTYSPEDYEAELKRLETCPHTVYKGYYGVTGFGGGEPLAVSADSYQGFVYAINTPGKEYSVTYVEIIFCNQLLDIDYKKYIPAAYQPDDFTVNVSVMPFVRESK
ncbi:MAG: zf-HC2 domain-containing protein [Oscillospiraceae bacterium]|nr:zf-HC2 domain-containing protein [Oscillospiraceae bacterium]